MCSKTRSGRDFSPYALDGVSIGEPVRVNFDLGAALRAAETRFETEPMSSEDAEESDDECELVRPPPTRPLSTHEKAALTNFALTTDLGKWTTFQRISTTCTRLPGQNVVKVLIRPKTTALTV